MKYCPVCSERFDEEVIRFCTKDGTPLVEETQPTFAQLPSESVEVVDDDDDLGQETIVRRKPLVADDQPIAYDREGRSDRIVIPTSRSEGPPPVRARTAQGYAPPPPPPNTAKTVVLTILGTLVVLGIGAGLFWFLQKEEPSNLNVNINANQNTNLNTNLAFDSNFNFNVNSNLNTNLNAVTNLNTNFNTNANTVRPSPTPSPRPSPTPAPSLSPTPEPTVTPRANTNTRPPATVQPTPLGTPRMGPRPPSTANRPATNSNGN